MGEREGWIFPTSGGEPMSYSFALVCHETKKRVWIGQGWGEMRTLYSGEEKTMESLKKFLNDHINKPLEFLCSSQTDDIFDYERV